MKRKLIKALGYIKGNFVDLAVMLIITVAILLDMPLTGLIALLTGMFLHLSDIRNDTRYMRNVQALAYLKYMTDKKEASDEKNQDNQS